MRVPMEGPLFLCKLSSHSSNSKMRILPWAMCQGGHFLQRWMTGGFGAGLHWSRLSEGQRGSLKPGWKQKRIRAIERLHARPGESLAVKGEPAPFPLRIRPAAPCRRSVPLCWWHDPLGAPSLLPQPCWSVGPRRKNPSPPVSFVRGAFPSHPKAS